MSNKSPIFTIIESHHFSDYGFDPQLNYFQVIEEGRKHKRPSSLRFPIDALHFKLQKPISKDDPTRSTFHKKNKRRWWKNALLFFKWRKWPISGVGHRRCEERDCQRTKARGKAFKFAGSISGPIYITESRSGSSTPYRTRTTSRPSSSPLARKGEAMIPYVSLREINQAEEEERISASSATAMPIYLVT